MGLHVDAGTANVGAGREGDQPFFLGVAVEADDGGQAPGHGGPGLALRFQLAPEALDVGPAHREQGQAVGAAPDDDLAQVEGVGVAGQPAVAGQEAGQRELLGRAEDGIDALDGRGCDWTVHSGPSFGMPGPRGGSTGCPGHLPRNTTLRPSVSIRPLAALFGRVSWKRAVRALRRRGSRRTRRRGARLAGGAAA